jgi:hypothetical protein
MKKIIIGIFCIMANAAIAQVIIDPTIANGYEIAFNKLPKEMRNNMQAMVNRDGNIASFAICTIADIDTLNMQDKFDLNNIKITRVDSKGKEIKTKRSKNVHDFPPAMVICRAQLNGDTLKIFSGAVFGPEITHVIIGKSVNTTYKATVEEGSYLKLNLSEPGVVMLKIPTKTLSCKLNTIAFKAGEYVYGEIGFITDPYYTNVNGYSSKTGYLQLREHIRYIFKAMVINKSSPYYIKNR